MAITRDQVFQAASELSAAGQTVTQKSIREALGNTGSWATIIKHLKDWKDQTADTGTVTSAANTTPLPDRVEALGQQQLRQLWNMAQEVANASMTAERQEMEGTLKAVNAAMDEMDQETERLTSDLGEAQQAIDDLRQQLKDSQQETSTALLEAAQLRGRLEAFEQVKATPKPRNGKTKSGKNKRVSEEEITRMQQLKADGLSDAKIGKELGRPTSTVRTCLCRMQEPAADQVD